MSTNTYLLPTQDATGARMDVGDIPAAAWNATGAVGMFAGLFWMLATGRMVTRREHDGRISDKDREIAFLRAANESLTGSVQKYAVSAETSAHALHEVEKRAAKAGDA